MYSVKLTPNAAESYRRAPVALAKKLARCFAGLETEPHSHPNIRRLSGPLSGVYRYRVGDHRVVYRINEDKNEIVVVAIVHRSKAYE